MVETKSLNWLHVVSLVLRFHQMATKHYRDSFGSSIKTTNRGVCQPITMDRFQKNINECSTGNILSNILTFLIAVSKRRESLCSKMKCNQSKVRVVIANNNNNNQCSVVLLSLYVTRSVKLCVPAAAVVKALYNTKDIFQRNILSNIYELRVRMSNRRITFFVIAINYNPQ